MIRKDLSLLLQGIVVSHLLYPCPYFLLCVPSHSHAISGFMVAYEAATWLSSYSVTRHRNALCVNHVDVEESTQRMCVLNIYRHALGFKHWQRGNQLGFVACIKVAFYKALNGFSF